MILFWSDWTQNAEIHGSRGPRLHRHRGRRHPPPGQAQTTITLESFTGAGGNGKTPQGSLIADAAGNLFGTTGGGGSDGFGTVFEITNSGFVTGSDSIPEPASLAILGAGLAGLAMARKRRAA